MRDIEGKKYTRSDLHPQKVYSQVGIQDTQIRQRYEWERDGEKEIVGGFVFISGCVLIGFEMCSVKDYQLKRA